MSAAAGHCVILQNKFEEGQVAWNIIRKGPERLQSQFAAGYGMVPCSAEMAVRS